MKTWIGVAAALLALPTAALACSCINSDDPAELRALAPDAAAEAVALVEVETTVAFQESGGAGDKMRVVRTIAGSSAPEFRVERGPFPSGASCDDLFDRGARAVILLYPASRPAGAEPIYRISGLCTRLLLEKPVFRAEVARLIAAKRSTERG